MSTAIFYAIYASGEIQPWNTVEIPKDNPTVLESVEILKGDPTVLKSVGEMYNIGVKPEKTEPPTPKSVNEQ